MNDTDAQEVRRLDSQSIGALIQRASEEIGVYRRRQITTFREFILVQALITWGIGRLGVQCDSVALEIRFIGALICLIAGVAGFWMIMLYKLRIHHIRNKRDLLVDQLIGSDFQLFYPTTAREEGVWGTFGWPTSRIYGYSLIIVGFLAALANVIIGARIAIVPI